MNSTKGNFNQKKSLSYDITGDNMQNQEIHIVEKGQTLYSIAKQYQTTVKQLMELNQLHNTMIHVGQELKIKQSPSPSLKTQDNYQDFIKENLGIGTLKIHTIIGNTYIPIENVEIEVYQNFEGKKEIFFSGKTTENGQIDNIFLPCPPKRKDYQNQAATYQILATHPNFKSIIIENVYLYDGIKSIQKIEMLPIKNTNKKEDNNGK